METEVVVLRLYHQLLAAYAGHTTPSIRRGCELVFAVVFVVIIGCLATLHSVEDWQPGCVAHGLALQNRTITSQDVLYIEVRGWTHPYFAKLRDTARSELEKAYTRPRLVLPKPASITGSCAKADDDVLLRWPRCDPIGLEHTFVLESGDMTGRMSAELMAVYEDVLGLLDIDPVYIYSAQRAFLHMPRSLYGTHSITAFTLIVPSTDACFGSSLQRWLLDLVIGYDAIISKSTYFASGGKGHLLNKQRTEITHFANVGWLRPFEADKGHKATETNRRRSVDETIESILERMLSQIMTVVTGLALFFVTTTALSLWFLETTHRIWVANSLAMHLSRARLPIGGVLLSHATRALVYTLVIIGVMFFVAEIVNDLLLALFLLVACWDAMCAVLIFARSPPTLVWLPRFIFLFHMTYYIYILSQPFAHSYLALLAMMTATQLTTLWMINHVEIPMFLAHAFQPHRPRALVTIIPTAIPVGGPTAATIPINVQVQQVPGEPLPMGVANNNLAVVHQQNQQLLGTFLQQQQQLLRMIQQVSAQQQQQLGTPPTPTAPMAADSAAPGHPLQGRPPVARFHFVRPAGVPPNFHTHDGINWHAAHPNAPVQQPPLMMQPPQPIPILQPGQPGITVTFVPQAPPPNAENTNSTQ